MPKQFENSHSLSWLNIFFAGRHCTRVCASPRVTPRFRPGNDVFDRGAFYFLQIKPIRAAPARPAPPERPG
jgi:hypothetical protein